MSSRLGTWLLRLFALTIAVVSWLLISYVPRVEERREPLVEREIEASVGYQLPPGYLLLDRDHAVRVRVRGRADAVRSLSQQDVDIQVPFPKNPQLNKRNEVFLRPDLVTVPAGVEVTAITPTSIGLAIDERLKRSLPIEPDFHGEPAAGAKVGSWRVLPPEAEVEGPRSKLEQMKRIYTEHLQLDTHALDFEEQVELRSDDPLVQILQPRVVKVQVSMIPAPAPASGGS